MQSTVNLVFFDPGLIDWFLVDLVTHCIFVEYDPIFSWRALQLLSCGIFSFGQNRFFTQKRIAEIGPYFPLRETLPLEKL